MTNTVYIVGAGPGDPDLLTVKAYKLLTEYAEIVVYDRLIPEELLNIIPSNVERVYAGKSCRKKVMTQDEINEELVTLAGSGKKVVRLKGGDPFIFGRGGEEIEHLSKNDIPFEVVPGISAVAGISSYLGIPLTHRGLATGVRYITGHKQKGEPVEHDWKGLADPETTLVVYMGLANLDEITKNLINAGLSENTPAVAIAEGTMKTERICSGNVADIAEKTKEQEFQPPTIIIIGNVVKIAQKIGKI